MTKKAKKRVKKKKRGVVTCPQSKSIDYSKPLKRDLYERFCQQYMRDGNGGKAATRAGYSENSADSKASQLLRIVNIKNRIAHLQALLALDCNVTARDLMEELKKVGFANIRDYVSFGKCKSLESLTLDQTAAIASYTKSKSGDIKIILHDKLNAIEKMGKHTGFFEKDNAQRKTIVNLS